MMLLSCSCLNTGVTDYCLIAKPLLWSESDTAETQHEILLHDAEYEKVCR